MTEQADRRSLYRRFRPQRFGEVVGQDLLVATLRRAVAGGKPSHAYLLSGQRGVGKTSIARILARAVNCLAPQDGEPCNRCESCRRILGGLSLDVVEIDGASNRGVDQIRRLREEVAYVPAGSRHKVYIIDEVHMLTGEAFNALLKTLEEPPPHVLFIFATTEPHKVPATVISRCQAFEFQPIAADAIVQRLHAVAQAEGITVDPTAAELIARRSRGALRDALVVLDQLGPAGAITEDAVVDLLGIPPLSQVDGLLNALAGQNSDQALGIVADLAMRGRDLALFLEEGATRARDRIIAGESAIIPIAQRLIELRGELGRAFSRRLHVEMAIIELCGPPRGRAQPNSPAPPLRKLDLPLPKAASPPGAGAETARATPAPKAKPPGPAEKAWHDMLASVLAEKVAVASFLAPAEATWVDGLLSIRLPADCGYHYESLLDPEVRGYVEATAHRFFDPLLTVHLAWDGETHNKPTLEEGAKVLAQALEGTILREGDNGSR